GFASTIVKANPAAVHGAQASSSGAFRVAGLHSTARSASGSDYGSASRDAAALRSGSSVNNRRSPDGLGQHPLVLQDRPECLVEIFAVTEEGPAQHGFLD